MFGAALLFLLPAANLSVAKLTGLKAEVAEVALGTPDVARREAKGALWTYRKSGCVLFVYLADKGDGLRVTGLSAGPRRAGEAAPSVDVCLAQEAPPPSAPSSAATGTAPATGTGQQ
jgi:hypothetical protein